MAVHDRYYTGSTVSRYLPPGDRSFDSAVYQSGKPVLDAELILNQEIGQQISQLLWDATVPSGWLRGPAPFRVAGSDPAGFLFPATSDPLFAVDSFLMPRRLALVAGMPVVVEYTNIANAGLNRIQLDSAPVFGGAPPDVKRTDFVFLEVFRALVSDSPNATATLTITGNPTLAGDNFDIAGNTLTGVLGAPGVDQYMVGASPTLTATNIAAAINLSPPNSFTNVTASASGPTVTLRAVTPGAAGNLLTFGQTGAGGGGTYVLSGATFAGGVDEPNKPTQSTLYRHGNVEADSSTDLPDDIADPLIGAESTKRVQIQYRLRVTGQSEAVNFKTEQDGFSNVNVLAQGTQAAPVALYPFVRADNTTTSGNSSAVAYGIEDNGLWIAGDGSSTAAAALGTVDGYVYAIPLCFVFRRNDSSGGVGWSPLSNTNGALSYTHGGFVNPNVGVVPAGDSDRPDGFFHDVLVDTDVLDLRRHVVPGGVDWSAELRRQMQLVMDGSLRTWAVDMADKQDLGGGSGDVSWRYLVCNEIGRDGGSGGVPPASGDTTRGVTIGNFDHVARRFADQPVVERLVLTLLPTDAALSEPGKYNTQANGGFSGWAENDEINIDLLLLNATGLGDFSDASKTWAAAGATVFGFAPPGTTITSVLSMRHDDGHQTTAVSQTVQAKIITGIGTSHIKIILDANDDVVNGGDNVNPDTRMVGNTGLDDGSQRRIFVELEITYPVGSGTTDTPSDVALVPEPAVYPDGPLLENDTTQRSQDWEELQTPRFREGKREIGLEYVANDGSGPGSGTPISDTFISVDDSSLIFARRIFGSGATLTTIQDVSLSGGGQAHDVDTSTTEYGSSSRLLVLDTSGGPPTKQPLSGAGQTICNVTYFAQDAIPNSGSAGGGYQVAVYYRSSAPQTAGVKSGGMSLPDPITVAPLVLAKDLWTGTTGPGSADLAFPYTTPMNQIPVNADIPIAAYPGEWFFSATAQISVDDFSADTGLLNLHTMVPADGTGDFTFSSADSDLEFRSHYKVADPTVYRPTIFAQPLSGVNRHKVWFPLLVRATSNHNLWRKNEVLLVIVTRFAELDDENTVRFSDTANRACVGIYRTRDLLLIAEGR